MSRHRADPEAEVRRVLFQHRELIDDSCIDDLVPEGALLLLLIGDRTLTVGDLAGDCYFGTNASYILVKLTDLGYLTRKVNPRDKRKATVTRTSKGAELAKRLRLQLGGHE